MTVEKLLALLNDLPIEALQRQIHTEYALLGDDVFIQSFASLDGESVVYMICNNLEPVQLELPFDAEETKN